jgi:hypothetical protein
MKIAVLIPNEVATEGKVVLVVKKQFRTQRFMCTIITQATIP